MCLATTSFKDPRGVLNKFKFYGEAKAWEWWQAGEEQWLARHRFGETDIKARKMSIYCVGTEFATVRPRLCCFTATAVVQRLLHSDLKYGKRYVRYIALF